MVRGLFRLARYAGYAGYAASEFRLTCWGLCCPARTKATFGKDTEEMLRQWLTFTEAIDAFDLMPRTRIKRIRDDL